MTDSSSSSVQVPVWRLYIDGAARGNPGKAGAGIVLKRGDKIYLSEGFFLGSYTNNQAEYYALVLGICLAKRSMGNDELLHIFSDSELLVRQVMGIYRVRNTGLIGLHLRARQLLEGITYQIEHVRREYNSEADLRANVGIDQMRSVPAEIQESCLMGIFP